MARRWKRAGLTWEELRLRTLEDELAIALEGMEQLAKDGYGDLFDEGGFQYLRAEKVGMRWLDLALIVAMNGRNPFTVRLITIDGSMEFYWGDDAREALRVYVRAYDRFFRTGKDRWRAAYER